MQLFKVAVQHVALAAFRRGYKRRELDRVWGKFLVEWWKAEEVRRGELRAWFRRMTAWAAQKVRDEWKGHPMEEKVKPCRFGTNCWHKDRFCPFSHPDTRPLPKDLGGGPAHGHPPVQGARQPAEGARLGGVNVDGIAVLLDLMELDAELEEQPNCQEGCTQPHNTDPRWRGDGPRSSHERIQKSDGLIWEAMGDGSCMYHSILGSNDQQKALELRCRLAVYARAHLDDSIGDAGRTVRQSLALMGLEVDTYLQCLPQLWHWGGELELGMLANMLKLQLKVFMEDGDWWKEVMQFGADGEVRRLLYKDNHYNVLIPKETWRKEQSWVMRERNKQSRMAERYHNNGLLFAEEPEARRVLKACNPKSRRSIRAWRGHQRKQRLGLVQAKRKLQVVADAGAACNMEEELLGAIATDKLTKEQAQAIEQILKAQRPWEALGVEEQAGKCACCKEYRKLSLLVHPDKCHHALAQEASAKLQDAHMWAQDREAWEEEKQRKEEATARQQNVAEVQRQWLLSGAALRAEQQAEELQRYQMELQWAIELEVYGMEMEEYERLLLWEAAMRRRVASCTQTTQNNKGQKLYCVCRKPHNSREYWIQCCGCLEWFHPRCLGTTQAECEVERRRGGWYCKCCKNGKSM